MSSKSDFIAKTNYW